jgi:transposase
LGLIWAKKGSKPTIPTRSQHNKRLNLFGWVAPLQGWYGLMRRPQGNTDGFLAFLRYIAQRLRSFRRIFLYVDGASWHKGERIRAFLREEKRIVLCYLPPYHPELNPQERIWHLIRYEVTTNRYYETLELIEDAIRKQQHVWKPPKIKSLCLVT